MKNPLSNVPISPISYSTQPEAPAALNTQQLFPKGSKERTIIHDNMEYRLRITAQGKLILTK
ncbi:hemin uptake protein HemP [Limnobacter thiooxidans]|nr:hemin uptake protein HemP [Limnobacter sp.]MCZ8014608.1 hemin uptake protein HemP [Limnobacter sp.]RZS41759.1 hemin uptake protein HemP [Limnobacter thiooxidans]